LGYGLPESYQKGDLRVHDPISIFQTGTTTKSIFSAHQFRWGSGDTTLISEKRLQFNRLGTLQ